MRRGLSLLEVLVSIFVLLFGLLGIAAVVPVARLKLVQTAKADRSAACGAACLQEIKTRRMLDPSLWWRRQPNNLDQRVPINGLLTNCRRESFAIDPLYVAATRGITVPALVQRLRFFPYFYDGAVAAPMPKMWRVTLDVAPSPQNYVPMPLSVAQRTFTWHDDLLLPVPDDDDDRPRQMMAGLDTSSSPAAPLSFAWPPRVADGGPTSGLEPKIADFQADYSWLVTVTPKPNRDASGDLLPVDVRKNRLYQVSIVVFFGRRDFSPPNSPLDPDKPDERRVHAQVLGGGAVRLITPGTAYSPGIYAPEYLDVKKGGWLLLMADPDLTPATVDGNDPPYLFQWYRVVAVGETLSEDLDGDTQISGTEVDYNGNKEIDWFREVTLAGPDWAGPTGTSAAGPIEAGLFSRVIGVYTRTMEMDDGGSLWAN